MIKVGTIVGDRYEILEKVGMGGMAEVFRGKDHKLNRFIAVKVLKEEFRENQGFVKKFKEEAQAAAGLAHPNIVNVYDVGDEDGIYYIVMELVEGITLKNYIERKGRLTMKEATSIAIQVSAGLEVAHNNQIVHRDIKPQNIIISREGKVKVTDFGIAKATTSQTTTSNAMGSVHYASPEQARGGYVDHRSDIYSLGIVLYEMVTGRVPFDGETAVTVAVKHLQEDMVPPSVYCSEISYSLEQIIKKCTEKSPDRRYQDIGDLLADLKQSLLEPDGDFVKMVDLDEQAKTVIMNKGTTSRVREARRVELAPEDEEDDDEEDDDDEEYDEDEDDDDEELSPAVERIMTVAGVALAMIIVVIMLLLVSRMLGLGKDKSAGEGEGQRTEESVDKEDGDKDKNKETADSEAEDTKETSGANTVVVPSLLGNTMTEAKIALDNIGLSIKLKGSKDSSEYTAGQIIEQSVNANERVDVGSTIDVIIAGSGSGEGVSAGTGTGTGTENEESEARVPKVLGETEADAKRALEAAGLKVGTVTESSSETVESGKVISQSLTENSSVKKGTTINLVISSGPSRTRVTDVIGHEMSRATEELQADGFQVAVKEVNTDEVRAGLVISSSPEKGTYADPGSTVTITVSKGGGEISIPSVSVGMTYEEAVEALEDAGFHGTIKRAKEYSSSVGEDFVTRYQPSGKADADGTVTIYVSLGDGEEEEEYEEEGVPGLPSD